jgi:hypothetical protein
MEIRTHNLVLGDHPCCVGGMALECGWAHGESELVDLDIHETFARKRRSEELRLGYSERRQRLQEVTGLSGGDLLRWEYDIMCANIKEKEPLHTMHKATSFRQALSKAFEKEC